MTTEGGSPALDPLLDTAPCGFLSFDETGLVRVANTTLAELLRSERSALEGAHIEHLLSPAGRIFYTTHLFPLLGLEGRVDELYVPLRTADGADLPVLVNGVVRDRDGATVFDLVVVPMRQRNELENELVLARNRAQEAAAAKDRFLSIVSHELRTPLAAVKGYAELLLRGARGPLTDPQLTYVTRIADSANYQVRLIEDILEFATLEGGRRKLEPARLEVEEVIARAESLLAVRGDEQGRLLRREPRPAVGAVFADASAVQQILLNLGVNAIKFSNAGSEVLLRAEERDRRVLISVRDTGPGIAPADVELVFEPFVQLRPAGGYADSARGVGLGLSISRDLARAMGGEIQVESVVGQGSTFTVDLPAAR